MPKSKHQKQQEAIERKRKALPGYRKVWLEAYAQSNVPTNDDALRAKRQQTLAETKKIFEQAAKEANCDLHGNPV